MPQSVSCVLACGTAHPLAAGAIPRAHTHMLRAHVLDIHWELWERLGTYQCNAKGVSCGCCLQTPDGVHQGPAHECNSRSFTQCDLTALQGLHPADCTMGTCARFVCPAATLLLSRSA